MFHDVCVTQQEVLCFTLVMVFHRAGVKDSVFGASVVVVSWYRVRFA